MSATNITPQQILFCKYYTTRGETFCNGTFSYAEAYDYDLPRRADGNIDTTSNEYNTCRANGSRLLYNNRIRDKVQEELLAQFNEKTADARLQEILLNGEDKDSIQAIKIFNDLKQRITKKIDVTTQGRPLMNMSDEELEKLAGN